MKGNINSLSLLEHDVKTLTFFKENYFFAVAFYLLNDSIRKLVALELFPHDILRINHTEYRNSIVSIVPQQEKHDALHKSGKKKKKRQTKCKGVTLANSRKISVLCKEGLTIKGALMPLSKSGFIFHVRGSELMHIAGMFLQNTNASSRAQCVKGQSIISTIGLTWLTLARCYRDFRGEFLPTLTPHFDFLLLWFLCRFWIS